MMPVESDEIGFYKFMAFTLPVPMHTVNHDGSAVMIRCVEIVSHDVQCHFVGQRCRIPLSNHLC